MSEPTCSYDYDPFVLAAEIIRQLVRDPESGMLIREFESLRRQIKVQFHNVFLKLIAGLLFQISTWLQKGVYRECTSVFM